MPAALWLNALVAGPIIASLSLYLARYPFPSTLVRSFLPAFSVLACVANAVVYVLQGIDLRGLENSLTSAAQQAPGFLASVPVFVVLSLLAAVIAFAALRGDAAFLARSSRISVDGVPAHRRRIVAMLVLASLLALSAVFVMRFHFYTLHMTVGLGV